MLIDETNCSDPPCSGFTGLDSIPDQSENMNVTVFYHEVNMVLWVLFSHVQRVKLLHEMQP